MSDPCPSTVVCRCAGLWPTSSRRSAALSAPRSHVRHLVSLVQGYAGSTQPDDLLSLCVVAAASLCSSFEKLLQDPEAEVRTAAAGHVTAVAAVLPRDQVSPCQG